MWRILWMEHFFAQNNILWLIISENVWLYTEKWKDLSSQAEI